MRLARSQAYSRLVFFPYYCASSATCSLTYAKYALSQNASEAVYYEKNPAPIVIENSDDLAKGSSFVCEGEQLYIALTEYFMHANM